MFNKLFGKSQAAPAATGPQFIPMQAIHLGQVKAIIEQTDEDDAEEAAESIRERFCQGMYVLEENGEVLGCTGAFAPEDTDGVAWLSWTYMADKARGKGLGKRMVNELLTVLHGEKVRKLFIATSDYREDGEEIYADAQRFYRALGATEELRVPAYHSSDETKIVFSMVNPEVPVPSEDRGDPPSVVRFDRTGPAPESDGGLALFWSESDDADSGLERLVDKSRRDGARALFAALPSDFSAQAAPQLTQMGFIEHGSLTDFYHAGLHQVWWSLTL